MNVNQTVIQSPKPFVKIKRLDVSSSSKTVSFYTDEQKIAIAIWSGKYGNGWEHRKALVMKEYPTCNFEEVKKIVQNSKSASDIKKTEKTYEIPTYLSTTHDVADFDFFDGNRVLQSYQFSLSKNDVTGSFSLTFFPESANGIYDLLEILDIVEIYENKREYEKFSFSLFKKDIPIDRSKIPVFIGIIKSKKYVSQVTDGGIVRRLQVSGISAAGLVSQFYLNLDTTAMCLTKQFAESESFSNKLTTQLSTEKKVDAIIKAIWESFCNLAEQVGTVAIKSLIENTMGKNIFDCDTSTFNYPLSNPFKGEQTQDFYSLIDGVIPQPLYEKFAYMDFDSGKMRIKIRQVPFRKKGDDDTAKDENGIAVNWENLRSTEILSYTVQNVDLTQSDNEVYTVFFSYLRGYPVNTDKLMRIIAMKEQDVYAPNSMIKYNPKKYQIYGYRPLIATFNGYNTTDTEETSDINKNLTKCNERLQEWFGDLERMLSGSITIAMTYDNTPIMPGEKVKFLGGEFYVEGISHNWTYGQGGNINLSVSRGGEYQDGSFTPLKDFTKRIKLLETKKG